MAKIRNAHLTGVKADVGKSVLKISIEVALDDYGFDRAVEELEPYIDKDHNEVDIEIHPKQMPLRAPAGTTEVSAAVKASVDRRG